MDECGIRKRAFGYVRVSTPDQVGDYVSLDNQKSHIRDYAKKHNIEILDWFQEEGVSAKTGKRPKLEKMLEACKQNKGQVDHIIVYNISRISRNISSFYREIGVYLAADGVTLRSTQEQIDETPTGKMMLNIALTIHQFDNDIKSQTTHDNMSAVAKIGYWQHQPPIGFLNEKVSTGILAKDGHQKKRTILVPDNRENRAETIVYLFNRMAVGDLGEMQLYNIAVKMGLRMPNKDHKIISFSTFDKMLRNSVYAGYNKSKNLLGGKMTKFVFDGLVDLETWTKVQYVLDGDKKVFAPSDDSEYPLKGTLLCECCEKNGKNGKRLLASAPKSGGGKPSPRYHCRAKGHCSISKNEMHEMFIGLLEQITPKESTIKLFKEIIRRTAKKKLIDTNKLLNEISEKESQINEGISQTLEAFLETHQIDEEEKQIRIDYLKKQRVELKKQRIELEKVQQLNETTIEYVCNFIGQPAKLWKDADLETKRAFQQMLFPNGLHVDLRNRCFKNCGTDDLSPLYSVMNMKNGSNDPSNSPLVIPARVELTLTG